MSARYVTLKDPVIHPVHTELQNRLAEMGTAHRCLMRDRTATLSRLKILTISLPQRHAGHRLPQITSPDAPTDTLVMEDAHLSQCRDLLANIPRPRTVTVQALFAKAQGS